MNPWRALRNFFGTTRSQTNGMVAVLLLLSVFIFSEPVTRWYVSTRPHDFSADRAELDSLISLWNTPSSEENTLTEQRVVTYTAFNPNTVTQQHLLTLGFTDKQAHQLISYRTKGGVFRIKADVLKLYGMDSTLYANISPYITLPDKYEPNRYEKKTFTERIYPEKEKSARFNLNEADTTQLQKIYGIGPVLANRIVKYRNRLGGFVSHHQLKEVYGVDSTVVNRLQHASFLPEPLTVQQLNLNTADEKTLAAHPYLTKNIARAIVTYRFQHGKFQSVDDLARINLLDNVTLAKISPYLTVDR